MSKLSETASAAARSFYGCYLLASLAPKPACRTYIGFTVNPKRRIRQHNGEINAGAHKTKRGRPWEMALVLYGFPSQVQALQFEWAWQNPAKSIKVRSIAQRLGARGMTGVKGKLRLLMEMLHVDPWRYYPLTLQFLSSKYSALRGASPEPPPHMQVLVAPLEAVPQVVLDTFEEEEEVGSTLVNNTGSLSTEEPSCSQQVPAAVVEAGSLAAKLEAVPCRLCGEVLTGPRILCGCGCQTHTHCMAQHSLQVEGGGSGIPAAGECPACCKRAPWPEIIAQTVSQSLWKQSRTRKASRPRKPRKTKASLAAVAEVQSALPAQDVAGAGSPGEKVAVHGKGRATARRKPGPKPKSAKAAAAAEAAGPDPATSPAARKTKQKPASAAQPLKSSAAEVEVECVDLVSESEASPISSSAAGSGWESEADAAAAQRTDHDRQPPPLSNRASSALLHVASAQPAQVQSEGSLHDAAVWQPDWEPLMTPLSARTRSADDADARASCSGRGSSALANTRRSARHLGPAVVPDEELVCLSSPSPMPLRARLQQWRLCSPSTPPSTAEPGTPGSTSPAAAAQRLSSSPSPLSSKRSASCSPCSSAPTPASPQRMISPCEAGTCTQDAYDCMIAAQESLPASGDAAPSYMDDESHKQLGLKRVRQPVSSLMNTTTCSGGRVRGLATSRPHSRHALAGTVQRCLLLPIQGHPLPPKPDYTPSPLPLRRRLKDPPAPPSPSPMCVLPALATAMRAAPVALAPCDDEVICLD